MGSNPDVVIHWFRRDLRIRDNTALWKAARASQQVVPVFIPSRWEKFHNWTGPHRQAFLCGCLASLDNNLRTIGGRLIVRTGDPVEILSDLLRETGAKAVFFNRDPDPHGAETERKLEKACREQGRECMGWHDLTLHNPHEVLTQSGDPYRVYTPFSKRWMDLEKTSPLSTPKNLGTAPNLRSEAIPTLDHWKLPPAAGGVMEAGERAAMNRLGRALKECIPRYAERRDQPASAATSRLSQDLRLGTLSPRSIFQQVDELRRDTRSPSIRKGIEMYVQELAWREFYMAILHHYPEVLELEFNPNWRGLPWDEPGEDFEAWQEGRTGFPFVDAGMRELRQTGFMHNRLRMVTAMFLTKDLHVDWRLGESFFMQHLTDGEISSNNGGWQWSAGTGADAAPYFRIQNPWSQSKRHDPEGAYIKRWLPELSDVPAERLHQPPTNGRPIAPDYPLPCVDHHREREKTLDMFKTHKAQQDG